MKNLDMNTELIKNINLDADLIDEIVSIVDRHIIGRVANKYGDKELDNLHVLLEYVAEAGGGNHLEIGTLFGGSAIAVALLKQYLGHSGVVVCIDPLDGYYSKYAPRDDMIDGVSGIPVTPDTLFQNIRKFDVGNRILVMQSTSQNYINLNIEFSTAYIDGDHQDGVPLHDWNKVKDVVEKFVIFDNYDDKHPYVKQACHEAIKYPDRFCEEIRGISYVVKRI